MGPPPPAAAVRPPASCVRHSPGAELVEDVLALPWPALQSVHVAQLRLLPGTEDAWDPDLLSMGSIQCEGVCFTLPAAVAN